MPLERERARAASRSLIIYGKSLVVQLRLSDEIMGRLDSSTIDGIEILIDGGPAVT